MVPAFSSWSLSGCCQGPILGAGARVQCPWSAAQQWGNRQDAGLPAQCSPNAEESFFGKFQSIKKGKWEKEKKKRQNKYLTVSLSCVSLAGVEMCSVGTRFATCHGTLVRCREAARAGRVRGRGGPMQQGESGR